MAQKWLKMRRFGSTNFQIKHLLKAFITKLFSLNDHFLSVAITSPSMKSGRLKSYGTG